MKVYVAIFTQECDDYTAVFTKRETAMDWLEKEHKQVFIPVDNFVKLTNPSNPDESVEIRHLPLNTD